LALAISSNTTWRIGERIDHNSCRKSDRIAPYLVQENDLNYCKKAGIRVEAWSPFAANQTGLFNEKILTDLADKYSKSPLR
jgi:Aldo/keto reductases, related to diketogulonate reductase